jgi:hypothetical protein
LPVSLKQMLDQPESEELEFKSSLRWDLKEGKVNKVLEDGVVKAVAALANLRGGTVLIGVTDGGEICGLGDDYASIDLRGGDRDKFERHLRHVLKDQLGHAYVANKIRVRFYGVNHLDVCEVRVAEAPKGVIVKKDKSGKDVEQCYVRNGNASNPVGFREFQAHLEERAEARKVSSARRSRKNSTPTEVRIAGRVRAPKPAGVTPISKMSTARPGPIKRATGPKGVKTKWDEATFFAQAEALPRPERAAVRHLYDWAMRCATVKFSGTDVGGFNVSFPRIYPGTFMKVGSGALISFRFGLRDDFGAFVKRRIVAAGLFKMNTNDNPRVPAEAWTPFARQLTELIDGAVREAHSLAHDLAPSGRR